MAHLQRYVQLIRGQNIVTIQLWFPPFAYFFSVSHGDAAGKQGLAHAELLLHNRFCLAYAHYACTRDNQSHLGIGDCLLLAVVSLDFQHVVFKLEAAHDEKTASHANSSGVNNQGLDADATHFFRHLKILVMILL
jgi:hypothetical protein